MTKKKRWVFMGLGIVVVLSLVIIYRFYFTSPAPFPTNEQLVEEINNFFPEAAAKVIQDTIPVDETHVLVPFISSNDNYSLSYWVWQNHKWRVVTIDTKGFPMVWKINRDNPSSYHFVWNIHPEDNLSSIDFYLIRDRGYHIIEGVEHYYYPRIQLEKEISLNEKSYGLMQLPDEWVSFMNSFIKVESAKQPNGIFNDFFPGQYMYFGMFLYDQVGKEAFPERSVNGSGYSNGNVDLEHVMTLNKKDIETQ